MIKFGKAIDKSNYLNEYNIEADTMNISSLFSDIYYIGPNGMHDYLRGDFFNII